MQNLLISCQEFSAYLLAKYAKIKVSDEDSLVAEIREFAPNYFFLPFIQFFLEYSALHNRTVRSKYILKILVANHLLLDDKDCVSNIDNGTGIASGKDKFIIPGTIVRQILRQDLKSTKEYLVVQSRKIRIEEMQEPFMEHLDKAELIKRIYEDSMNGDKFIIS